MFARGGDGGGDDPYNFDIADGFSGGGSKKKTKQSKFEKPSFNKTVGASPSGSSLIPQDSSSPTSSYSLAKFDSKAHLRASAPAAPTSALDKAMSFLDKYKKGISSTASKATTNVSRATCDEDELDISLSSDSDSQGGKPAHKAPSRLKAGTSKPGLRPQRGPGATPEHGSTSHSLTLSGVPSSARFATANELGISLDGPKAAVSPVGLQEKKTTRFGAGGASNENHPPALRLAVDIPGESSARASLARHAPENDVESVESAVSEALEGNVSGGHELEEESHLGSLSSEVASNSEADCRGTLSLRSPTLEKQSGSARTLNDNERAANDTRLARAVPDRTSFGKIMSFDELACVSGQQYSSGSDNANGNGPNSINDESEASAAKPGRCVSVGTVTDDEDNEDDYGDDEFEDQDVLMESNGEREQRDVSNLSPVKGGAKTSSLDNLVSRQPIPGNRASPPPGDNITADVPPNDNKQDPGSGSVALSAGPPVSPLCDRFDDEDDTIRRPREAWAVSASKAQEARPLPATSNASTSHELCVGPHIDRRHNDGHERNQSTNKRASTGAREAWGTRSASGTSEEGDRYRSHEIGEMVEGSTCQPLAPKGNRYLSRFIDYERGTGKDGTHVGGSVSKRGLLIDRSTEVSDPKRPLDSEVKVVVREEAVASIEYARDPERGVDLRSCGTQMVGNSAAVQANIAVPGMVGTHSSVCIGSSARNSRTAGVGYRSGEPYAKWGRFSCEMPNDFSWGRDLCGEGTSSAGKAPVSPRCYSRSPGEFDITDSTGKKNGCDIARGTGEGEAGADCVDATCDGGSVHPQQGQDGAGRTGCRSAPRTSSYTPLIRGGPAYLETFLDAMAKSQGQTCDTWQSMLETRSTRAERINEGEGKGTEQVAEETDPCARHEAPSTFDQALHSILAATQNSFREQLANMRENLNKIRYRAEVAGRQSYVHNYESVKDVHDWLARARPPATSPAEAMMIVDPSLSVEKAKVLVGGGLENETAVQSSTTEVSVDGAKEPKTAVLA